MYTIKFPLVAEIEVELEWETDGILPFLGPVRVVTNPGHSREPKWGMAGQNAPKIRPLNSPAPNISY